MSDELYTCPACGFLVFSEQPGSYEICDVCGWEDDHVQLAHPNVAVGANGESLQIAQRRAVEETPLEIRERDGYQRDPLWRPLEESDLDESTTAGPADGREYFNAAVLDSPEYYWSIRPHRSVEAVLAEIDQRVQGQTTLRLWIPTNLSLMGEVAAPDLAMAVIVDRLLSHDLFPDGIEEVDGGRVYKYIKE